MKQLTALIREVVGDNPEAPPRKLAQMVAERTSIDDLRKFYALALEPLVADRIRLDRNATLNSKQSRSPLRTRIAAAIDRKYTEEAIGHTYEVCLHAADAVIRELELVDTARLLRAAQTWIADAISDDPSGEPWLMSRTLLNELVSRVDALGGWPND